MQIERIFETKLTSSDEVRINSLLVRAFDEGFGERSFHQQRHTVRFVARDRDLIIGHMALCYRSIRLGVDLVRIIGLGEVSTDPKYQGQGIATKLIGETLKFAQDSEADFYLLFGDRPIYAGHGFSPAQNHVKHVEMYHGRTGQVVTATETSLMVLPLKEREWDASALVDLLGHMF